MKKKVICGLLTLLLIFALLLTTKTIQAWLQDMRATKEVSFTIGKVEYKWDGEVKEDPIVPGENIITSPFQLLNLSTIPTELRFRLFLQSPSPDVVNSFSQISLDDNWVLSNDGYYYYQDLNGSKIYPEIKNIIVLQSLVLDGNCINNEFSGEKIEVKLLFEAKQFDYVEWEELGTANISLG